VAAIAADGLGHPIAPGYPYLEAEVVWGVRHEMASRPMDILARRTPLALLDTKAAVSASDMVVEIMAGELGWNLEKQREEERDVRERLSSAI
jgi:glycerol-3-phosphate dehydrogenase